MTVSSRRIRTAGGRRGPSGTAPRAARPASPVETITSWSSGSSSASSSSTSSPSGTFRKPSSAARPMLRTIERPTRQTRRPCAAAASSTCCTRCTWLAKQATMIRAGERWNTPSSTGPISRSAMTKPGTSALVESTRNRSTPSSPSRENPARSVSRPSSGSWSSLMSPVCSTSPAGVRMATASASGMEWLTAKYSQSNAPCRSRPPSRDLQQVRGQPVLPALGRDQGQREPGADDRQVRALPQQERHRADVVLVAVGQHQRVDVVQPVLDGPEVGQDQVDARASPRPGTAPRSRRPAAARRTRTRSCCGRSRRSRRARPPAARRPAAAGRRRAARPGWPPRAARGVGAPVAAAGGGGPAVGPRGRLGRVLAGRLSRNGITVPIDVGPSVASPPSAGLRRCGRRPSAHPGRRPGRRRSRWSARRWPAAAAAGCRRRRARAAAARPWRRPPRRPGPSRGAPAACRRGVAGPGRRRRPRTRRSSARSRSATTCPMTLTNPTAPTDSHGRFTGSSPE